MTGNVLFAILATSVVLFGTVEPWSLGIILSSVFTLGLFWVLRTRPHVRSTALPLRVLLLSAVLFLAFGVLQVIPFPSGLVRYAAPAAFDLKSYFTLQSPALMTISLHPYRSVQELLRLSAFFIVFSVSALQFQDRSRLKTMLTALAVFGFCLSLFAIIQKASWNGKIYWFRDLTMGGTPFGPFVNRNHYAGFIGMIIPLGLGLMLRERTREKKILFGFLTVIMTLSLFLSLSRGGIVSFLAGMLLFVLLIVRTKVQAKRVLVLGIFLLVVLVYLVHLGIGPVIDRFASTDVTGEERIAVWGITLQIIGDFWLAGSGLGTFMDLFSLHTPPAMLQIYDHAHNDYLEILLETGVLGSAPLLFFFGTIAWLVARSDMTGRRGTYRIAAASSVFTMAVHSVFDFNLHIFSNLLAFGVVLGILTALLFSHDEPSDLSKPYAGAGRHAQQQPAPPQFEVRALPTGERREEP